MHRLHQLTPQALAPLDFVLRLVLAGVLFYASADKLLHPQDFARMVAAYHALPGSLVPAVAVWLPWLELVLGLCLFAGLWAEGAAALTAGLFGAFWLLLIVTAARGIDVDCGCFSSRAANPAAEPPSMLFFIGRDAALLGLALFCAWARLRLAGAGDRAG